MLAALPALKAKLAAGMLAVPWRLCDACYFFDSCLRLPYLRKRLIWSKKSPILRLGLTEPRNLTFLQGTEETT